MLSSNLTRSRRRTRGALVALLLLAGFALCVTTLESKRLAIAQEAPAVDASVDPLLQGVSGSLGEVGSPGIIAVWGEHARPLIGGERSGTLGSCGAFAFHGSGSLLVFGHGGLLEKPAQTPGRKKLFENYLALIANDFARAQADGDGSSDAKKPQSATIQTGNLTPLMRAAGFVQRGFDALPEGEELTEALSELDLLSFNSTGKETPEQIAALADWVKGGGHLMTALGGWIFTGYFAPGNDLRTQCPLNDLLQPAGMAIADGSVSGELRALTSDEQSQFHALHAYDNIRARALRGEKFDRKDQALNQSIKAIESALRFMPNDETFFGRLSRELPRGVAVSKKDRVSAATPLKRLSLTRFLIDQRRASPSEILRGPGVEHFPGDVPSDAKRVSKKIELSLELEGWVSTGLYAAPAEAITLKLNKRDIARGLTLRIGCHKDSLYPWRDEWYRYPEISWTANLDREEVELANPWGGLIYVEVPSASVDDQEIKVEVNNAVESPRFVLGDTSNREWQRDERDKPAPWAELGNSKMILTVPSDLIRSLDDPEALMEFWDDVRDQYATLSAKPLKARPERMVVDINISNGYMHAGYPIMMQTFGERANMCVDLAALRANPRGNGWGLWHELGHNHQEKDWTYSNTTEVTVNLFSLFVVEHISGDEVKLGEKELGQLREYQSKKLTWRDWGSKPFHGLLFYWTVIEEFGWEPFSEVFAEYRDLADDERPQSDLDKRDQWLLRFSRTLGKDLSAHFDWFGVEVSESARDELAKLKLPTWESEHVKALGPIER